MASITIRNLEEALKGKLRIRAAEHSRSMEEEVRAILRDTLEAGSSEPINLYAEIRRLFAPLGGVELELPLRELVREPPRFDE
jgi:plasmid stability protein